MEHILKRVNLLLFDNSNKGLLKRLILILTFFFPIIIFAEYNGVHVEFEIQLNNGTTLHGYKYIAHGNHTEDFKKHLEKNPNIYLKNQYSYELGEYGGYKKRLEYIYQGTPVFKLIEPYEIKLDNIKFISIKGLIESSYAIQIAGNYTWNDRIWMRSKPIGHYTENENMCSYITFIHKSGDVPIEVIEQVKLIIKQTNIKLEKREEETKEIIHSDKDYNNQMRGLYNERRRLLNALFKKHKPLKTIVINLCTC